MAKDLPYFKFNAAEWISGEITLEDLTTQGVFVNICAYYWFKSGCLTLSEIKRRVKCKQTVFDRLIEQNLIKVEGDLIEISFLKAQLDERGHISKKNSENGKLGGAPKGNKNAEKNNPKQPKTTNIEEKREEEKRREKKREEEPLRAGEKKIVIDNLFPLGTPEHNAWEEWRQYRKEIKKTLSPSTAKKQMQFLGGRAGPEIVEIINQSIKHGWTGLFPLKTEQNGNHVKGTNGTTSAQIAGTRYTGSKL